MLEREARWRSADQRLTCSTIHVRGTRLRGDNVDNYRFASSGVHLRRRALALGACTWREHLERIEFPTRTQTALSTQGQGMERTHMHRHCTVRVSS